jgi:uncharacterized lipoprotein YmbA
MSIKHAMLAVLLGTCACSSSTEMVPLLSAAGIPLTDPTEVPLRVVTRSTAVHDPLRVRGTGVVYGDVETTLGHAIASATVPWAKAHENAKNSADGWELFVEVTNADAWYEDDRIVFSLAVRATLRQRSGNDYLAQTQASCRQGGIVAPQKGAPVIYGCMMEIGRTLGGWLEGVDLDAVKQ